MRTLVRSNQLRARSLLNQRAAPLLFQVRCVFLDDVMAKPEAPELACIADYETRSLR